jgi:hypothetical protein
MSSACFFHVVSHNYTEMPTNRKPALYKIWRHVHFIDSFTSPNK